MKLKVLVYRETPRDILNYLETFFEVEYIPNLKELDPSNYMPKLKEFDGFFGSSSSFQVTNEILDASPKLKIISNVSSGYNNLNIEELSKRKIMATNTSGSIALTESVADMIIGLMIVTARRMFEMNELVRAGGWNNHPMPESTFGIDVHHKTLGIIGLGNIGSAVAKRAHFGFGMNIVYHSRSRKYEIEQEMQAKYLSLNEIFKTADFICVMTPLTLDTKNLIGEKELSLMKKSGIIIDASRGGVINESALIKVLTNKDIYAAGLDVYENEPINSEHPFLKLSNIVTLPHIGSATVETKNEMIKTAAENLIMGLHGKAPPNLINKEVLKGL